MNWSASGTKEFAPDGEDRGEKLRAAHKPPFGKPMGFVKLFDARTRAALTETIQQARENAIQITAL